MRVSLSSKRVRVDLNLSGVLRDIGALDPVRIHQTHTHLNSQSNTQQLAKSFGVKGRFL